MEPVCGTREIYVVVMISAGVSLHVHRGGLVKTYPSVLRYDYERPMQNQAFTLPPQEQTNLM